MWLTCISARFCSLLCRVAAAPIVLVMSPTRELAMQTAEVAVELGAACNAKSICIYGGVSKDAQVRVRTHDAHHSLSAHLHHRTHTRTATHSQ